MKIRSYIVFIFLISSILFSCSNDNTFKIEFDDVAGLTAKSPVQINGFKIGEVRKISINSSGKVIVEVSLTEKIDLKEGATFAIESVDLLGTKSIVVNDGTSSNPIDLSVIQKGNIVPDVKKNVLDSSITNFTNKFIDALSPEKKLDSINAELKKLNSNIENIDKQK